MVASYLAQGAFKETTQALFILAFAIGLLELRDPDQRSAWGKSSLAAVPLALIAVGSVYVYSFPGLSWLAATAAIWAAAVLADLRLRGRPAAPALAAALRPAALALLAFFVLASPGDRAHGRLRQLRDLRPRRSGARKPVRPDLAPRGAGDLAVGRLPADAGRRRGAGARLLRGGGAGARRCSRPACAGRCAGASTRSPRRWLPRFSSTPPPASAAPPTPQPRRW